MKNQESKQFTRDCIRTALIHLMNEHPYEKITVTALIQKAGVSRAGFYRNYSAKDDVLDEIAAITYSKMTSFITDKKYENNPYLWYYDLFSVIQENPTDFQLLIKAQLPDDYKNEFSTPLKKFLSTQPTKEYYRGIAVSSAVKEILIEWFINGMKETPEEMASFFMDLFHH